MKTNELTVVPVVDSVIDAVFDKSAVEDTSTRTYIRVKPTKTGLTPSTVKANFQRLHSLTPPPATRKNGRAPTIECLLVSPGADEPVAYYFSVTPEVAIDGLEQILRTLFPTDYAFERTTVRGRVIDEVTDIGNRPSERNDLASVTFQGCPTNRKDWQTRLTPLAAFKPDTPTAVPYLPLAAIADVLAPSPIPTVYQALLRPKPDWSAAATRRIERLESGSTTLRSELLDVILGREQSGLTSDPSRRAERRMDDLDRTNARHSFDVTARAVAVGDGDSTGRGVAAERVIRQLEPTFTEVGGSDYAIESVVQTGQTAVETYEAIRDRRPTPHRRGLASVLFPWVDSAQSVIVADPATVGNFCLLSGAALPSAGNRAVAPAADDERAATPPPPDRLAPYQTTGLPLGRPAAASVDTAEPPVTIPPALQSLHVAWFGPTGAGKTTALTTATLANSETTAGADIIIAPKGDGMPRDYLQAHYAKYGDLDDVIYFDCERLLPAFTVFDIRDELADGIDRASAVEDVVEHYMEILEQLMGTDRFEQAVRSPTVIRYLVKACFDPVEGDDVFAHHQLLEAARAMQENETPPAVSDSDLERLLESVTANDRRSFQHIMGGVANRLELIPADRRLSRVFNHVPDPDEPHFDIGDHLEKDVTIIVDIGGLRDRTRQALTLLVLSNCWTALRRRARGSPDDDHALVNIYLEEAASVADTELLGQLLAQSRGFDCALTLAMQYPGQLDNETAAEVCNNVGTVIAGAVPSDNRLPERLATDDMPPPAVGNRLRSLARGEWLVSLPSHFGNPPPKPFTITSLAPAAGIDEDIDALDGRTASKFETHRNALLDRTAASVGLQFPDSAQRAVTTPNVNLSDRGFDSPLAHTDRLPDPVKYNSDTHAISCSHCDRQYDPSVTGMRRAIGCCAEMDDVDRRNVPICDCSLTMAASTLRSTEWTIPQLLYLQMVLDVQFGRVDPLEFDVVRDSMALIKEYVGLETAAIQALLDAGLLIHDTDAPHRLYSISREGRDLLNERIREGIDFGDGVGDLHESTEHVLAVELGRRYLMAERCEDPASAVETVEPYYEDAAGFRIDVVGLDADGEIVATLEAERLSTASTLDEIVDDYDKMAAHDPETALWVVPSNDACHRLIEILNDPPDGTPRVEKTYSENMNPTQFNLDADGLTDVFSTTGLYTQLNLGEY